MDSSDSTSKDRARSIVITTIHDPTEAVRKFNELEGWELIVVGDRRTPDDWSLEGAAFVSVEDQRNLGFRIGRMLPENHYSRKMIGYLIAIKHGASVIFDTDDDNKPNSHWKTQSFETRAHATPADLGFVNIYRSFSDQHIWPRGFPLELILDPRTFVNEKQLRLGLQRVGIWQALANGSPDVDAIYRLTINEPCTFRQIPPIVLSAGTICPFNSQSTAFRKEVFPLLFLPAFVTFRFTDILRGLVAQPVMWAHGYRLGFTAPTVTQERNPHDLLVDFESELPCYLHAQHIVDLIIPAVRDGGDMSSNLLNCYRYLNEHGIVVEEELDLLSAWLEDLASLM